MQEFLRLAIAQLETMAHSLNDEHVMLMNHRDWMIKQRSMTPAGSDERHHWNSRLDEDHDIGMALHKASVDLIKARHRLEAVRSQREKSSRKARKAV